ILHVTAKDKGTGKEQSITIQNSGNLSKEDVEKAAKEAEANAEADKKKREAIDAKNSLENGIYQAEKLKKDNDEKLSDDDKKELDAIIEAAKKSLESEDKDTLEAASKELTEKLMPIGAKLYEAAAPEDENKADGPAEGEVVDEKDSDKKEK
ncbi:MAG TPA: Hsp70 family protein, partial [Candidatus Saccharibacteria bacterium]|nr:Hsp70 family protein [Candidatus Saccharibacteria bacterium]